MPVSDLIKKFDKNQRPTDSIRASDNKEQAKHIEFYGSKKREYKEQKDKHLNIEVKDFEKFLQDNADFYKEINEYEARSIRLYTQHKYEDYNYFLREGKMKNKVRYSLKESTDNLKNVLENFPNYEGIVYRGSVMDMSFLNKLKDDDVIFDPAFLSTSVKLEAAKKFSNKINVSQDVSKYIMILDVIHGKLLATEELSLHSANEFEVLLLPETRVKITNIDRRGTVTYIYGKEIEEKKVGDKNIYQKISN
ncbi:ADP-ribosyltransferase [Xenorhabdus bovienii]|uniref:ADP-ribosyltransferase n=1 Tax=Xenorhabdus bovienii TaxID=40576 RepID=UPI00237D01CA|nr:ADP-ribosyltransferase [Xenorhabdus bovienii]MDE1481613.1 hypothetical protein [Xenorhabdus bovienii]MDE9431743.1 hypothetical protein [Xenorhabdus bovienii]MDE9440931.1 hypothetical protein [Xenorhabdus bovienii]MDE9460887.1 hypothetical protein [Xenorhabdus bovienii]MDE9468173.1 hypothetical protein [Xenorhabdus bovienii]